MEQHVILPPDARARAEMFMRFCTLEEGAEVERETAGSDLD